MARQLRGKQLADLTITGGKIANDTINGGDKLVNGSVTAAKVDKTGTWDFTGGDIQVPDTPSGDSSAVNKGYVDSVAQGLDIKGHCEALSDSNITLSGLQTIDSIGLQDGDRVLCTAQTNQVQNGIWVVHSSAWTRPDDFQSGSEAHGAFTFVTEGVSYEGTGWVCISDVGYSTVDTDPLEFTQFSGAGSVDAGAGLQKSGNTLFVGDVDKGVQVNANDVQVDASEIAGDGLEQTSGGGNEHILKVKIDSTGSGTTIAPSINNDPTRGLGVKVDGKKISWNGSGQLTTGKLQAGDTKLTPSVTSGDGQDSGLDISTTPDGGRISVFVNGVQYMVGSGVKTEDCYFSVDGGTTARTFVTVAAGDSLYWNGVIAGFDLEATDIVDMNYVTTA